MQVLDAREVAAVKSGDVLVRKSLLNLGMDGVVGVRLEVGSRADRPVAVAVVESFPAAVEMDDVEIHPEYDRGSWTVEAAERRMRFDPVVGPGATVETVYGVRAGTDGLEPLTAAPTIERVGPVPTDDAADSEAAAKPADGPSQAPDAADGGAGEGASATEADEDPAEPVDDRPRTTEDVQRLVRASHTDEADGWRPGEDSPDEGAAGSAGDSAAESDGSPGEPADESFEFGEARDAVDPGDVTPVGEERSAPSEAAEGTAASPSTAADDVDALVAALTERELTDEQRRALRDALGVAPTADDGAQRERLREAVGELDAFADEFERLVEAVGSPADAVETLRSTQAALDDRVDDLDDEVDALDGAVDELAGGLDGLADRVDGVDGQLAAVADHVERLDDDLARRFDALERRLDGLDDRLANRLEAVREAVDGVRDDLRAMDERLEAVEGEFDSDEARALQEVIAAERRWRRRAEGPGRRLAPGARDRER